MVSRGVVFVAVNNHKYLESATIGAIALRQHNPDIPILIISDLPILEELPLRKHQLDYRLAITEIGLSPLIQSRRIKTQLHRHSPFEETLYIDADMLPITGLKHIWKYLESGDLAMAKDRLPEIQLCDHVSQVELDYTLDNLPKDFPHFNSGVILWRKNTLTDTFFERWHKEWQRFQKHDQLALARSIGFDHVSQITVIPKYYNISPRDAEPLSKKGEKMHLLHCWGGKVDNGRFKKLAKRFCPKAVAEVDSWQRFKLP